MYEETSLTKLRSAIEDISSFAHDGFAGISAIAAIAIHALDAQVAGGAVPVETIKQLFSTVRYLADDMDQSIRGISDDTAAIAAGEKSHD